MLSWQAPLMTPCWAVASAVTSISTTGRAPYEALSTSRHMLERCGMCLAAACQKMAQVLSACREGCIDSRTVYVTGVAEQLSWLRGL